MYFHAGWLVVGLTFVQALMPETRGLTMSQITAVFKGEKASDVAQILDDKVKFDNPEEDLLEEEEEPSDVSKAWDYVYPSHLCT